MIELKQTRGVPSWVSALAVLLCLGCGGAFAWWAARDGIGDRIIILDRAPGDGVKKSGRGAWRITAGYAVVQVTTPASSAPTSLFGGSGGGERSGDAPASQAPTFEFFFAKYDFLDPRHVETLSVARRLVTDRAMAAAIGVTPEQMAELQDVRKQAKVLLSPDDEQRLAAAWPRYAAAKTDDQRKRPEDELIRLVEHISERLVGPAKQSAIERSGRVKAILTDHQWGQLEQLSE